MDQLPNYPNPTTPKIHPLPRVDKSTPDKYLDISNKHDNNGCHEIITAVDKQNVEVKTICGHLQPA